MAMMMAMAMRRRPALSYFLSAAALLLAFLHAPLATAQPLPWQLCSNSSGNYTENSACQANIRLLATNASSSPALFATGAAGTAPDVVYALALCRGDTNASSCAACVATAFQNAQQLCALNKGVTMYDDPCILRFSDRNFLANVTDNRGRYVAWNYNNVSAAAPQRQRRGGAGVRRRLRPARQRHRRVRGGGSAQAVRQGGGGVRRDLPQDLLAGAVHAGHDGGRLPELPRGHNREDYAQLFRREAWRESLWRAVQLPI